ncbi:hypothetical protein ACEWY4_014245 [Coilia grayii]|uniref:PH domain-containing protein n=1 Tax=Coilia grayii TaxID=363190 RepID=A0ABD1JRQ9_9TELE
MGGSASSQLDETTSNHIRVQTEGELKAFSAHYRRQYCVALCSKLQEELEQQNTSPALLLKHREPSGECEVLYEGGVLQCEDGKKWRDRWAVIRDYTLELHDSQELWKKGTPARQKLVLVGGSVVTTREKYEALLHKAAPDLNNGQEDSSPELLPPSAFPVYLKLPYRRHIYLCCHDDEQRRHFLPILSHGIRHQNHDSLHKPTCEMQAFLAAIDFHRQEKGNYESWDMLVGDDTQVLTHLVMEGLNSHLQKELLPQLKGKRAERRRVWLSLVEAAHTQVLAQVQEGLQSLKEECSATAQQQGALLRSNMDQISSSRTFLETKLQGMASEGAHGVCAEQITPYLTSVLEELLGPVNGGFQAVRQLCEERLDCLCKDVRQGWSFPQVQQALQQASKEKLEEGFQGLDTIHEKLQGLQQRFGFSNTPKLVQGTQTHMQQLMDNAIYTFESLLQSAKDNPGQLGSVMDKAKARVLKQYDYDSSTVRKHFFQEALIDITLPVLRRHLAPTCRPELEKFEQYIFADCTDFIRVENVYEDILTKTLTPEVNKVVKEAASQKKHNLFVDSSDLQAISQGSLTDSRTPPRSPPSSPPLQAPPGFTQLPEMKPSPLACTPGTSERPPEASREVQQQQQEEKSEKQGGEEKEEQPKGQSEPPEQQQEERKKEEKKDEEEVEEEEVIQQASSVQVASPPPAEAKEDTFATVEPVPGTEAPSALATPATSTGCTDRAFYINAPTGVPAGSAVPLCDDDSTNTTTTLTQAIEGSDLPIGDSGNEMAETAVCATTLAGEEGAVFETGEAAEDSEGTGGQAAEHESTSAERSAPEPTAGGATAPPCSTNKAEEEKEEEEEEVLDSVKAIRDLVVEVIEVEDFITPCPDGSSP